MEHTLDIFLAPDKSGAFELFLRTQTGKAYMAAFQAEIEAKGEKKLQAERAKVAEAEAIAEAKTREAEKAEAKAREAQLRLENQVFKMERKGLPITDIAEFTGLSIDEINTILGK